MWIQSNGKFRVLKAIINISCLKGDSSFIITIKIKLWDAKKRKNAEMKLGERNEDDFQKIS